LRLGLPPGGPQRRAAKLDDVRRQLFEARTRCDTAGDVRLSRTAACSKLPGFDDRTHGGGLSGGEVH
jgi:hypothetical protein